MSDLYVKKRDTSLTISSVKTNTSAKDILATSLNAVSLPSSSSSSSTVKKLQVTIPQEQVHNIKTNVGRLTVCKRTVIKSETSNSLISHLKIVKNNRFTKRSIFDNHNHSSLSITQKINEQIKPLNSN